MAECGDWHVGYYACTAKVARNAQFPIHVLFAYDHDWPENVLRQRGLLGNRRLSRLPHDFEREGVADMKRAHSAKYRDLPSLIEDEIRCGTSEEFIAALRLAFREFEEV